MDNNLTNDKPVLSSDTTPVSTHIRVFSYNATELEETAGKTLDAVAHLLVDDRINWLLVNGLKDTETIRQLCEHFSINYLVLQDILNTDHATKIEEFDAYTVVILKLFKPCKDLLREDIQMQQLCIIQGSNYILTFLENDTPFFDNVIAALRNNTLHIRSRQSDYLLSVQMNNAMRNYTQYVLDIDDAMEDLEEVLLDINADARDLGIQIQSIRRKYIQIKKSVVPLKEQFTRLLHSENKLTHKVNREFFIDVNDNLQLVLQTIDACRETLSSLVDIYLSSNDLRMNDIMKRLTVVSTIFIPLTFLVGVWGMNFQNMPELELRHGYLFAWILMVVVGVIIYFYFKRKRWY
ncbi:MAG: magnesium/cobalt transporter CorA [Prevotellaceae bacterium]|jgi:magnesium transporter|nr:magnesium/cobalt transporter CorA [Prevotellaceae bacterium]